MAFNVKPVVGIQDVPTCAELLRKMMSEAVERFEKVNSRIQKP